MFIVWFTISSSSSSSSSRSSSSSSSSCGCGSSSSSSSSSSGSSSSSSIVFMFVITYCLVVVFDRVHGLLEEVHLPALLLGVHALVLRDLRYDINVIM